MLYHPIDRKVAEATGYDDANDRLGYMLPPIMSRSQPVATADNTMRTVRPTPIAEARHLSDMLKFTSRQCNSEPVW